MRRVEGSAGVSLMECTNPVKDKWRIRWDVQEKENGSASYMEEEFGHKPTDEEIRTLVMSWYNSQTDAAILSGFAYNGAPVWLSTENQYNYKAAYDLPFRRAERPFRLHSNSVRMNSPNTIPLKSWII